MNAELESLLIYLEDEFRSTPGASVRLKQRAGERRSPDLVQDYDPETHDLHRAQGVIVRISSREYFFPVEWAKATERARVHELILEIRKRFPG